MRARAWAPAAASLLVYTIVTLIIGRDVLASLATTIAQDPGDPLLTAAILKWNATHLPLTDAWWQFPIFYPTRDTMAFSEHLLGLSVIASPIYWVTQDLVVTYNLVLLLTFPLCAAAMYALVYRLTGSAAGAFVAGLAFGFGPYRMSQLSHIQMLAAFWAPLALLGLHAYIDTGRRRWLALYGATWMLQGAANGYALVFFSVLVGFWTLWFVVVQKRWRELLMISLATVVAVLPLAPILYKYATVHAFHGFARSIGEIRLFSADVAAVLCAPVPLTFWGWVRVQCGPEGELFPGVALALLSAIGGALMVMRLWTAQPTGRPTFVAIARRVLLLVAAVFGIVVVVVLVSGPFRFEIGPVRVSAASAPKPLQVALISLVLALLLSEGLRETMRRSSVMGFYLLAAGTTWVLALGPTLYFMGQEGRGGPFAWLMLMPGVDGLRVPARFWLMTVLCLSVVAGLVLAELLRGRSRRVMVIAALIAGSGVLTDGWIGHIPAAPLPSAVPGAATLRGATVLDLPADTGARDIASVFRAVNGGWRAVNGYSGWGPSYYFALLGASRAEVDALLTPFQTFGELHVLVSQDAPRLRSLVERQPGVSTIASDALTVHYLLPRRDVSGNPRPQGKRLPIRGLRSPCAAAFLPLVIDGDERTSWQCALWDERQTLTIDLGDAVTVGAIVHSLGFEYWLFPLELSAETSEDGTTWTAAWSGPVLERVILEGMDDPKQLRLVLGFSPRTARFIRLRAVPSDVKVPWTIAELELWSSASEGH